MRAPGRARGRGRGDLLPLGAEEGEGEHEALLQALLDEDSLSAAGKFSGLSERGARRLFERLVALGAARELTGRATFRLYGL